MCVSAKYTCTYAPSHVHTLLHLHRTPTHTLSQTGDKIKVTARVNEEWIRGELGGRSGIFPASFVDAVPPNLPLDEVPKAQSPASPSPSADTKPTAAKVENVNY